MPEELSINHLIRTRRSIFPPSYNDQEIDRGILETILENANYAPTHRFTEPWRFTVFRGEGLKKMALFMAENYRANTPADSFSQAKYDAMMAKFLRPSCILAISMELHPELVPEWEEVAAVSCAVQNMWLTASAYGIGAYWSTPGSALEPLHEFLNLAPNQKCLGLFMMGYHDAQDLPARRKPIAEKVVWVEE